MVDHQSYVEYRSAHSRLRNNKQAVPQGGLLSNLLFNYYVSKLPSAPAKIISYEDDCTVTSTGRDIQQLEENINEYLPDLHSTQRNLQLSAPKSSATIFTTWTKEVTRKLNSNGQVIPTVKQPKVLAVIFDSLYMLGKHTEGIEYNNNFGTLQLSKQHQYTKSGRVRRQQLYY